MKKLFITLFLMVSSLAVFGQDYYWYKGTKVPLVRGCRRYIIYEDDKLSESDKSHITYSEDVFYDEIPNLKWGTTSAHAVINDTAHVHYSTISYRKDGDYYDNLFITHRFFVKLKNQEDLPLLEELAAQNSAEIESKAELVNESGTSPAWYILRCKLDAPKNALELANLFYETTDLFSATEPEMINIILREFPKAIKSLCDEWNVLEYRYNSYWGGQDEFHTLHYTQKTDTFITNQRYAKLYKENNYLGALREGNNADIYYIPSDSTHEYLLYAFNAHVGDTLKNVWLGFQDEKNHLPFQNVIVKEIQTTNPRTFVLDVERKFINDEIVHGELKWLEGIGFLSSPDGGFFDPLAGGFFYNVLCAYMEGEQVYTSEMGQKYGCYYDGEKPQDRLPSLCDEWNVLMDSGFELGPVYGEIWTNGFKVQGDTIINNIIYSRLLFADGHQKKQRESREWVYYGALREAANAEIYFIPAGKNKEYLLYAFNAQVGDRMNNLYIMDDYKEWNVWAIVKEISGNEIILDFYEQLDDREDVVWHNYTWVKGIGAKRSMFQPLPIHIGGGVVNFLLCAYNDEKHIYTSEFGEKYGCEYNGEEPMFTSDTRWDYVYTEMYGGPDYKPTYFSIGPIDTLINHIRYQQIRGFLFRSEGAKVWCLLDSMGIPVERLVYDFDLQIGDSIRTIFTNWEALDYYPDPTPQYVKVTKVENITLPDGRSARRLSYDYRPDDIEHIGSVDGIFAPLNLPISTCGCGDHFLCCTRGDILLYEVAEGACDTFFVDNRPYADTIPLFKDGPGSSTVQPVDPNQIVAVLQMDVLSIFEHIGKEIGYKLTVLSSSENASASRRMVKSDTFEQSVSVSLAESGTYMLELTNPDWDYTIVGTFEYNNPHGIEPVETSVPSARKIMRDGQLLIRKGEKIYTLTGVQIQ